MREESTPPSNPSHPCRDIYPIRLDLTIEKCTYFVTTLSRIRVVEESNCCLKLLRLLQSLKFINRKL